VTALARVKDGMINCHMGIEPTAQISAFYSRNYSVPWENFWAEQVVELKFAGSVEFLLLFRVMHFGIQVDLGYFQRLVAQPTSDLHQVKT